MLTCWKDNAEEGNLGNQDALENTDKCVCRHCSHLLTLWAQALADYHKSQGNLSVTRITPWQCAGATPAAW